MNDRRPRGRPRPQETIERDNKIMELLRERGPLTRNALAEALDTPPVKIWLALDRLRKAGLVRTCDQAQGSGKLWSSKVGHPCP